MAQFEENNALPGKPTRFGGLWRSTDFLKLWTGQTISELGSRITRDGLPLLAVITLGATPSQMGLLSAIGSAPVLLVSLFAGVWVDRLRRKPLMIAADIGRALLLSSIPLAAVLGVLGMGQLYVVTALVGILSLLFSLAYLAYLPSLVERKHLEEGNSKLALSDSAAEVAGPGIAGVLIQVITAPMAILFDALSFLVSALSLAFIRKAEPPPAPPETRQSVMLEAREGLKTVTTQPVLRALALAIATMSFFGNFFGVLYGLFAVRELGIGPAALGLTIGVGGIGSLLGALLSPRVVRRFGLGRTLIGILWVEGLFSLMIPLAGSFPRFALPMLTLAQLGDMFGTIFFINAVSLRQSITPDRLLGRVSGSMELLVGLVSPVGALVGGVLAEQIGVQVTLLIAVFGIAMGSLWLLFSPVRALKVFPLAEM